MSYYFNFNDKNVIIKVLLLLIVQFNILQSIKTIVDIKIRSTLKVLKVKFSQV